MIITRETTVNELIELGIIKEANILLWNIKSKQMTNNRSVQQKQIAKDKAILMTKLFKADDAHDGEHHPKSSIRFECVEIGVQFFKSPVLRKADLWTKVSASNAWCVGGTALTPFEPEDLVVQAQTMTNLWA